MTVRFADTSVLLYAISRDPAEQDKAKRANDILAERDLAPHHYGVPMALGELNEPCVQQRLSDLIGIDSRNVVPIIDALVDRDLLSREIDPKDRRRRLLALSDAGRDMVEDLTKTGAAIEARFLRPLDPADQIQLHRILLALVSHIASEGD